MAIFFKKGLDKSQIEFVGKEISRVLPEDYKNFLKKINGFFVDLPDFCEIDLDVADEGIVAFDRLFGFSPDDEVNDLVSSNKEFASDLSYVPGAIIVGEDGGGNPYVILNGEKSAVYYWDRTHLHVNSKIRSHDIVEENDAGNLYFVCHGFDSFLDILKKGFETFPEFIEENSVDS